MSTALSGSTLQVIPRGDREIVMARFLHAARGVVYDAWTQPRHVVQWYCPPEWTLALCLIDLRAGGAWRYVLQGPDGTRVEMGGVYREVVPGQRVVSTESVGGAPGESLNTLTLVDHGGQTAITAIVRYESETTRDAVLASRVEVGAGASFDRLEHFLQRR